MEPPASSAPRVIVVDDAGDSENLCEIISRYGFEAIALPSARAALQRLDKEHWHLVVCELHMPDFSGWELLKAVKKEHPKTHVVLMSDGFSLEAQAVLTDREVDGYLTRPVKHRRLQLLLRALLTTDDLDRAMDVVVVDPDRENLSAIEAMLGDAGMFYNCFSELDSADAFIDQEPPHLLITEAVIGSCSGLDLCEKIRLSTQLPYIPILVMSSSPTQEIVDRAVQLHVNGLLAKPIYFQQMRQRVLALLRHTKRP